MSTMHDTLFPNQDEHRTQTTTDGTSVRPSGPTSHLTTAECIAGRRQSVHHRLPRASELPDGTVTGTVINATQLFTRGNLGWSPC